MKAGSSQGYILKKNIDLNRQNLFLVVIHTHLVNINVFKTVLKSHKDANHSNYAR